MKKFVKTYYVVHIGRKPGIYTHWEECKKQIDKFDGAIFKKFTDDKDAKDFLKNGFGEGKKPRIVTRRENEDKRNSDKILNTTLTNESTIIIYTDGSCIKGSNKLTRAGYGIYIPEKNIEVAAPLLNQKLTNNRAEMMAILESIKYLDEEDFTKKICILTDSQYSMYIFHGTGERYEKNKYRNDKGEEVPNIDLIKRMLEMKRNNNHNIELLKVRAHTGKKDIHSLGNEKADKLANDGAFTDLPQNERNFFNNICNKKKKNPIDSDDEIDANIQMNELFEFDEKESEDEEGTGDTGGESDEIVSNTKSSKTDITSTFLKLSKKKISLKSTKLSKWFTKTTNRESELESDSD